MGLDTSIVNDLLVEYMPDIFVPLQNLRTLLSKAITIHGVTVIIDMMKFRFSFNHKGSTTMLPVQALACLDGLIKRCLDTLGPRENIAHLILILDKSEFVPKEKGAEQRKRAASRAKTGSIPYENDMVFDLSHEYDMMRLMITPHLIRIFWSYAGSTMTWSLLRVPSVTFDKAVEQITWVNGQEIVRIPVANAVGEADLAIHYWMGRLGGDVVVFTADTDQLATALAYLKIKRTTHTRYYWIRNEKPREFVKAVKPLQVVVNANASKRVVAPKPVPVLTGLTAIDMLRFYDKLPQAGFVTSVFTPERLNDQDKRDAVLMAFILCGTDFLDKKLATHRFGCSSIIAAALRAWPELNASLRLQDANGIETLNRWLFYHRDNASSTNGFIRASAIVDRMTLDRIASIDGVRIALETKAIKSYKPVSIIDADAKQAAVALAFNWNYWQYHE